MGWGCAQTRGGQEAWAVENLVRQEYDAFCPYYIPASEEHRRRPSPEMLFPRYVFILIPPDRWWGSINGTRGVVRLLTAGNRPMMVRDEEMERINALRRPRRGDAPPGELPPDAVVRIRKPGSPMLDLVGTVSRMTKRQRVQVLMSLLSREVEVTFDREDLDVVSLPARPEVAPG